MKEKLEHILSTVTGREIRIAGGESFKLDLGIDSLTMIDVVLSCENEFALTFDQSELTEENLLTTDALLALLEQKSCR